MIAAAALTIALVVWAARFAARWWCAGGSCSRFCCTPSGNDDASFIRLERRVSRGGPPARSRRSELAAQGFETGLTGRTMYFDTTGTYEPAGAETVQTSP